LGDSEEIEEEEKKANKAKNDLGEIICLYSVK
jgi:hypothetical protein